MMLIEAVFIVLFSSICECEKRLLMEESLQEQVAQLRAEVDILKNGVGRDTYTRWGRTTCPEDNELVYKGYAAGSYYNSDGGAANWLCLPDNPQWGFYEEGSDSPSKIYGTEYQFGGHHADGGSGYFGTNLHDEDAPCVVCRAPRSSVLMIPARHDCYTGWTKEYNGYLVSGSSNHAPSEYLCLDERAEAIPGGNVDNNGKLFYLVDAKCGALTCPPYVDGRELTCVVCSK